MRTNLLRFLIEKVELEMKFGKDGESAINEVATDQGLAMDGRVVEFLNLHFLRKED